MPIIDCQVYLEGNVLPGVNQNAAQLSGLLQSRGIERAIVLSLAGRARGRAEPATASSKPRWNKRRGCTAAWSRTRTAWSRAYRRCATCWAARNFWPCC